MIPPKSNEEGEEERLRAAAIETSPSIIAERDRADRELLEAKRALEEKNKELARAGAVLRTMLEATSDGILLTDLHCNFTDCNGHFREMWSIPQATIASNGPGWLPEFFSRSFADPVAFRARLDEIDAAESLESYDLLELSDGRFIERFSKPERLGEEVIGRIWSFRDITERRRVEAALRENEARFRGTFEQGAVGMAHLSTAGVYLRVNDKLCALLGYERSELQDMTFLDVTIPEDRHLGLKELSAMLVGETSTFTVDKRFRRKTGEIIWLNVMVTLERDAAGEPSYMISVVRDISERKASEDALRESEARFRELADHLEVAFWISSPDMQEFQYLSPATERIWGRPLATLYASIDVWPEFILSEDRERVFAALTGLQADSPSIQMEYRIIWPDGAIRWIAAQAHQVRDPAGKLVRLIGLSSDVTERKRTEEELSRARESLRELNADLERRVAQRTKDLFAATQEAERANRAKAEFLSRTSHELRTPMHAILGFTQLLEGEENLGAEARAGVAQILKSAHQLLALINELLDVARPEDTRWGLPLEARLQGRSLPQPAAAPAVPPVESEAAPPKTLLYVEQDLSHRRLISRLVARRPAIALRLAASWAAGFATARAHPPDLIIFDFPEDGSGIDHLAQLRADPQTEHIPVVLLSAKNLSDLRELMAAVGRCAWVQKPVEVRALLAAIDQFIH